MIEPKNDWEIELHRRLRSLPEARAPRNLVPAVLQKIALRQSCLWWKRPWLEWPLIVQIVSAAVFAGTLAGASWWQDSLFLWVRHCAASGMAHWNSLQAAWTIADTLLGVAQHLVDSIRTPYLMAAGMFALALYLALVALGTLFCRVAVEQS